MIFQRLKLYCLDVKAGKKNFEVSQKSVEFFSALFTSNHEKLQILSEGTARDGGFLVPEEFVNVIIEDVRDISIMRGLASVTTTTSDTVHIPGLVSRPKVCVAWRKGCEEHLNCYIQRECAYSILTSSNCSSFKRVGS